MENQIVNISIDRELWKEVSIRAVIEDKDKKEIVDKALREYLEPKKEEK